MLLLGFPFIRAKERNYINSRPLYTLKTALHNAVIALKQDEVYN